MEINIASIKDGDMTLRIKNEDISILYILQHVLLEEGAEFAGFALKHPLTQEYMFRIVANDPIEILVKAINKSINDVEALDKIVREKVESI